MAPQSGFWRKCRTGFRWCRFTALFVALVLLGAFLWFNRIGLPDFLKQRLVATLRARGIELAFTRMRLHLVRGLVIENVRIGGGRAPDDPVLSLAEIQLQLNYRALLHRQLQIDGLVLRQGRLTWALTPTNVLTVNNLQSDLRFGTNDTWALDQFQAGFAGAQLTLSGDVVHAPELRNWDIFRGKKTAGRAAWHARLRQFSETLNRIQFTGIPQLSLTVNGDARDVHSFKARLNLNASGVQTPWGGAQDVRFTGNVTAPANAWTNADPALAWWTNALPYRLTWTAQLAQLQSPILNAETFACRGVWQAPELNLTHLAAKLGGGQLFTVGQLNVTTRRLAFTTTANFDVHVLDPFLTEKTRERLAEFSWTRPPVVQAGGSLVLPAWTNRQPDWRADVQPTIQLNGELTLEDALALGARLDWAHTHFTYSNLVWQLPDLALVQAQTRLALSGGENDRTRDYRWRIRGRLDPEISRPFLTASNAARGLDHFTFTQPLALDVEVGGRLYDYDSICATGRVALTNFTLRGQTVDNVAGRLAYSNRVLEFFNPRLHRAGQMMTADRITLKFDERRIYFTNGLSTADPEAVARAIGPKTGQFMEPYHFGEPPTVQVNGCVPLRDVNDIHDVDDADLTFDIIKGAPFQWLKFRTPGITGRIHWLGEVLILTNLSAAFYGGHGTGHACFDFRPMHEGADYDFIVNVTNANLHALASDLSSPTNHLEGTLSGQLVVTHADSRDWQTWDGFGHASLHDGLLWDLPLFGMLTPVLNTLVPGLGDSRATDAAAKFTMTNGVIYSDSLEIRSTLMRLEYAGTVDLKQNVHARVTAQLLRDAWVIGPVVSTVLWPVSKLFEYQVSGTLKNPKTEPVYVIPKLLLLPLHPIRSLEGMLPGDGSGTASPAKK